MIKIIQCNIVILVITFTAYFVFGDDIDLSKNAENTKAFIFAGKFDEAEPLVRQCLKQAPEEIYFLSQLDMVLNGRGRYDKADENRNYIKEIWEEKHKPDWIAKGSPVSESTWVRMVLPSKDYYVIGTEYFQPEIIGTTPLTITSFYKIIALPKSKKHKARIFKLEMSKIEEEYYVLRELLDDGGRQIIPYGSEKPDIRKLVTDAVSYLNVKHQQNR